MYAGFVYIWRDSKRKRFYIGSHLGKIDDGYICGSSWMKLNYKKHPQYFKRKILEYVENKQDILSREYYWLKKIKQKELGNKYYNKTNYKFGHWIYDEQKKKLIINKMSIVRKGKPSPFKGIPLKEEIKQKISNKLKGRPIGYIRSMETRDKISKNSKRLFEQGKIGMTGKLHSEKTKKLMSMNNAMNNFIYREKIKLSKLGIKYLNKEGKRKMAIPNSDKWIYLISNGWKEGYV